MKQCPPGAGLEGVQTMNDNISQKDIQQLARVSCEMVNQVDFEESGSLERSCQQMGKLLSGMLARYRDNELLFDALSAVSRRPLSKLDLYTVTRDIVRLARETPETLTMVPAPLLNGRHSPAAVPVYTA